MMALSPPFAQMPGVSLSNRTVRRRIADGEIPAVKLGQGPNAPVRVDRAELEAWLYSFPPPPEGGTTPSRRPSRTSGEPA